MEFSSPWRCIKITSATIAKLMSSSVLPKVFIFRIFHLVKTFSVLSAIKYNCSITSSNCEAKRYGWYLNFQWSRNFVRSLLIIMVSGLGVADKIQLTIMTLTFVLRLGVGGSIFCIGIKVMVLWHWRFIIRAVYLNHKGSHTLNS